MNIIIKQKQKTMTCNETTHAEYAKSMKKFCQDCGKEMTKPVVINVLEQLNNHAKKVGKFSTNDSFKFIVENQLVLNEDIIIWDNKFYSTDSFIKTYPFMKFGTTDFTQLSKYIYEPDPIYFNEKKEEYDAGIPTDVQPHSKEFCKDINKQLKRIETIFDKKDEEKVITFINKKIQLLMFDETSSKTAMQQYLLQDCLKENKCMIEHENHDQRFEHIGNIDVHYGIYDCSLVRTFKRKSGSDVVIRPGKTGFYMTNNFRKCTDIDAIRAWFDVRPESWVRNKELEEEYLKQYK